MCYKAKMHRNWFTALMGISLISASGDVAVADTDKRAAVLARLNADDIRVVALGLRLAAASAARCSRKMPSTGLILHSIDQYQSAWLLAATRQFGKIGAVSVEGTVESGPAAIAGIVPGDEVLAINGTQLSSLGGASQSRSSRRDMAEDLLGSLPPQDPVQFVLGREGKTRTVTVQPIAACRVRFEVVSGTARFARTDGRVIQVGQRLVAQLADDEIAFVLAHELAHSILDHRARLAVLEKQVGSLEAEQARIALAREFEDQADRLSVQLLQSAGFDPLAGLRFLKKSVKSFDRPARGTRLHRSPVERAKLIRDEFAKLNSVPAN